MCRHLAYLGPPATLRSVLIDPPHGLYRQSWAPRRQRHGTMNADGFGIGWYADGDPVPARYRRGIPIWGDPSLPDLARVTRSAAVLAAVRDATPGMAAGEQAAAPFASDQWLFSHNGGAGGLAGLGRGARPGRPDPALARGDGGLRVPVGAGPRVAPGRGGDGHGAGRDHHRHRGGRRHRAVQLPAHRRDGRSRPPPGGTRSGTAGRPSPSWSRPSRATTSPGGPRSRTGTR